jgi:membrane-bound lytic murein transglycosylase A
VIRGSPARRGRVPAALLLLAFVLGGCAIQPVPGQAPVMGLEPVPVEQLPGWGSDKVDAGVQAFRITCARLLTLPADQKLGGAGLAATLGGTAGLWGPACAAARAVPAGDEAAARAFLARYLQAYRVSSGGAGQVLFTGYFEPEVAGSLRETSHDDTPLYGRPADLVQADLSDFAPGLAGRLIAGRVKDGRLVPYFTRAEITAGALQGRHLEIAWLSDPVAAFVLQIQGAGRIRLPDGQIVRVGFAGENGRPYVPIGRMLAERGDIPKDGVTLQAIVAWLEAHPAEAQAMMDQNPAYDFFRILPGLPPEVGPPGALGVPLTPGRALAVDRHYLPLGAPMWVATADPETGKPLDRLMVAEDIGGAIKTPLRADIFFGWGNEAEALAGRMNAHGAEYVLLPRPPAKA